MLYAIQHGIRQKEKPETPISKRSGLFVLASIYKGKSNQAKAGTLYDARTGFRLGLPVCWLK